MDKQTQQSENADGSSLNLKRKHENDDSPTESKYQRPATPEQPTKCTDLNDDCLQKIFEHLNLIELFNVAVANEWLRPAAGIVYKRKFGMKKVEMYK